MMRDTPQNRHVEIRILSAFPSECCETPSVSGWRHWILKSIFFLRFIPWSSIDFPPNVKENKQVTPVL
jgi:hypothetical protein